MKWVMSQQSEFGHKWHGQKGDKYIEGRVVDFNSNWTGFPWLRHRPGEAKVDLTF